MKNKYTFLANLTMGVAVFLGAYFIVACAVMIIFLLSEPQPPPTWINLDYLEWFFKSGFYAAAPGCIAFICIGGYFELKQIDEHYRLSNEPFR